MPCRDAPIEVYESLIRYQEERKKMPCRCDDYGPTDTEIQMKKIDKLTQMLCWCCGNIEFDGLDWFSSNYELSSWWNNHREADEKRVRNEMIDYIKKHPKHEPSAVASFFIRRVEKVHAVSIYHREWFLMLAKELCALNSSKESLKKQALSKLTKEEKQILGISDED